MSDTQRIIDEECIIVKYDESPAKIRLFPVINNSGMNPVKFRPSSGERKSQRPPPERNHHCRSDRRRNHFANKEM
ncbi:hypothetical protein HanPSC8_Chr08g0314631 [Helianthus annuus]|nr:hypothetical protein HanPSC8_Chr08g0314631 [Helianthus annuus]